MTTPQRFALVLACALGLTFQVHADPLGTGFTYQGQLTSDTNAANGDYDFKFVLYDAPERGTGLATNIVRPVGVTNGFFTATLDFGGDAFTGAARWLEIGVKPYSTDRIQPPHTVLAPRQSLRPVPYALDADVLDGYHASEFVLKEGGTITGDVKLDASLSVGGPGSKVTLTAIQGNGLVSPPDNTGIYGISFAENGSGLVGRADWGAAAQAVTGKSDEGTGGRFAGGTYGINASSSGGYAGQFGGNVRVNADYAGAPAKPQLELNDSRDDGIARLRLSLGALTFWDIAARTGADGNALRFYSSAARADLMTLQTNGTLSVGGHLTAAGTATVGALSVGGTINATGAATVKVLTITGGADVAEPFTMADPSIPKGAVVIIDEAHPGQLKLSERAYDTRVAGIVSGANGIHPGLSLSQQGLGEGGRNVALSGRVYVQADATSGAIKAGDLLTTSEVPGYAMKVTDPAQAQGAILGKAMSPLNAGKGLVLVLVTLQ